MAAGCFSAPLPGEQVHVVGHAGQALALPHERVLLLLPLLHLHVQVRGQQPQLQAQFGDAGLLLVTGTEEETRFSAAALGFGGGGGTSASSLTALAGFTLLSACFCGKRERWVSADSKRRNIHEGGRRDTHPGSGQRQIGPFVS